MSGEKSLLKQAGFQLVAGGSAGKCKSKTTKCIFLLSTKDKFTLQKI